MNMDAWITGNQGHDHPDNDLCPECREDADHHCPDCGACRAEVSEECETCIDEIQHLRDIQIAIRKKSSELDELQAEHMKLTGARHVWFR